MPMSCCSSTRPTRCSRRAPTSAIPTTASPNAQTNYLLQRIEEHDGIVLLASNSRDRFDPAFRAAARCDSRLSDAGGCRPAWSCGSRHLGHHHDPGAAGRSNRLAVAVDLSGGHIRKYRFSAAAATARGGPPPAWDGPTSGSEWHENTAKLGRTAPDPRIENPPPRSVARPLVADQANRAAAPAWKPSAPRPGIGGDAPLTYATRLANAVGRGGVPHGRSKDARPADARDAQSRGPSARARVMPPPRLGAHRRSGSTAATPTKSAGGARRSRQRGKEAPHPSKKGQRLDRLDSPQAAGGESRYRSPGGKTGGASLAVQTLRAPRPTITGSRRPRNRDRARAGAPPPGGKEQRRSARIRAARSMRFREALDARPANCTTG